MPARLRVASAFLPVVVFFSFAPGLQAQAPENARDQYCGRTSCRELGQVLTTAVTTAKEQLESSRSRLQLHEVRLKGPFSRLVAFMKEMWEGRKTAEDENKRVPRTVGGTGPKQRTSDNDTVSVYNAHEVEHLLSSSKKTLIKGLLKNPDSGPLVAYIQREFPVTVQTTQIRASAYVEPGALDRVIGTVKSLFNRLLAEGPGPVSLHFTSIPESGATIVLKVSKRQTRNTVTEGSIPNLARGLYQYQVIRDGFKTADDWLDLANEDRENVECHLQLPTSSQSSACIFK